MVLCRLRTLAPWKRRLLALIALGMTIRILVWNVTNNTSDDKEIESKILHEHNNVQELLKHINLLEKQLRRERENINNRNNTSNEDNIATMSSQEIQSHIVTLSRLKTEGQRILEQLRATDDELQLLVEQQQQQQSDNAEDEDTKKPHTSPEEFEIRQNRFQEVCQFGEQVIPGKVRTVFRDNSSGVLYCLVPKAGCTFWKRIFYVVDRRNNMTQQDVFNISRNAIHGGTDAAHGVVYNATLHSADHFPTRLVVTRDPFSRLLSAFLDKIYLPDFWFYQAHWTRYYISRRKRKRQSIKDDSEDFMRIHYNGIAKMKQFEKTPNHRKRKMVTQKEYRCGKFVTFADFIRQSLNVFEPHWLPIHQICNPCVLGATHVSTMGTFTADARAVLAKMGMEDVLDDMDNERQVDIELDMIVNYNFYRIHNSRPIPKRFYTYCITNQELAYRLWHNFQWRGYIDPDAEYVIPEESDEEVVKADLLKQIWRARASGLKHPEKMRAAKNGFFKRAFESLPKELFDDITRKYKLDFELFGYESKRDELKSMYYNNSKPALL